MTFCVVLLTISAAWWAAGSAANEGVVESAIPAMSDRDPELCYGDCNLDGIETVADFGCFQTMFAAGNMYADCNGSGTLTISDFGCFQSCFGQCR